MRWAVMQHIWFITNPGSGSTSQAQADAIAAAMMAGGLTLAGTTDFPEQRIPTPAMLDAGGVDTVVLYAGDGTINAALSALADWDGAFLILPGGTMNLLAGMLHPSGDPLAIVKAAMEGAGERVALPHVRAEGKSAYVGAIIGPAAHWFRAREAARAGRLRAMMNAVRHAWRRTFGRGVSMVGMPRMPRGYQAVYVRAEADGLRSAGIDAREWRRIIELGWLWVSGEWLAAEAVTAARHDRLSIDGRRPVLALFDGEPAILAPGTVLNAAMTPPAFIATHGAAGA